MITGMIFSYLYINQTHLNEATVKHVFRFANPSSAFPNFIHIYKILHTFNHSNLFLSLEYSLSQILVYYKFWIPCCTTVPQQKTFSKDLSMYSVVSLRAR